MIIDFIFNILYYISYPMFWIMSHPPEGTFYSFLWFIVACVAASLYSLIVGYFFILFINWILSS